MPPRFRGRFTAPDLLARRGIGPVRAATAIVAWSHPGCCGNDAAFAALAGASPVPASSGRVLRHRLNRGGDRQLNKALHTIANTRWRDCPRTAAYIQRRRAEGKADVRQRLAGEVRHPDGTAVGGIGSEPSLLDRHARPDQHAARSTRTWHDSHPIDSPRPAPTRSRRSRRRQGHALRAAYGRP
jgi:transposase IS116/IS110/IS902 family protein